LLGGTTVPVTQDNVDSGMPMGATARAGGVSFRTWAPLAQHVYVLTGARLSAAHASGFQPDPSEAMFALGDGTWAGFVPGLAEGAAYMFWIAGSGSTGLKRDPWARELTSGFPNSDCLVRMPGTYPWHDQGYHPPAFRDLIIYQLHIGVFYGVDSSGNDKRRNVAKFFDVLDRVDYLRELGINAVQLLPIQEYPSETSRGYNGLDLYSPELDYEVTGTAELNRYLATANRLLAAHGQGALTIEQVRPGPNQLKCLIDILHLNGIAVLFDLVFNHAGGGWDDRCIKFFDRQPYGDENRSQYFTDQGWVGGLIFAYWKREVRQFLIDNAVACVQEYHIDGIRYDEVTVIDNHGGGRFSQDLTNTVRFVKPQAIQIAEYWRDDRDTAVKPSPNGLGFDAAWGDRVRAGVRNALSQAGGGRDAAVDFGALSVAFDTPPGFPDSWRVVNCLENHDIVYDGNQKRVPALADGSDARSWFARSRSRVAAGLLMVARGIPMLFMGQEFLEEKQWDDNAPSHPDLLISWDGLETNRVMKDYLSFIRDMNMVRRSHPALRGESLRISRSHSIDRVIVVHRWIEGVGQDVLFVANLQEQNRYHYRIGFPGNGTWREIMNSDYYDDFPNPSVAGNGGNVHTEDVEWDGMPASAELTIPANGFVIFSR
jgi:1,4-alpha-glucan branching enzyme